MNHQTSIKKYHNLDATLNYLGFKIVQEITNLEKEKQNKLLKHIDKALGVLVHDGVYAYYIFCKAQDKKVDDSHFKIFVETVAEPLSTFVSVHKKDKWESFFQKLSEDLRQLLFFREMLERILIYARYHAKALGDIGG